MVPKKATRLNFEQDDGHRRKALIERSIKDLCLPE
jgi:hypothetical protein